MKLDDLQKAWQAQGTSAKPVDHSNALLREVQRNQQRFAATIFWRDVREVGAALLVALFFGYHGWQHADWAHGLAALFCLGVGAFMVANRVRQHAAQPKAGETLKACVESSLAEVNHQIWLLRNVVWSYLLPLAAAVGLSLYGSMGRNIHNEAVVVACLFALVVGPLYWWIYRLNQAAVRKNLEPRKKELESILSNLN